MKLGEFLAAAMLAGGAAYHAQQPDPACGHALACRFEAPTALTNVIRVGERFVAGLPR